MIFALLLFICCVGVYVYSVHESNSVEKDAQKIDAKIIIYSKAACGYCVLAKEFLDKKGILYEVVELTNNKDLFIKLSNQTGQNTVPYVFISGKFIGGYQDLIKYDFR